MSVPRVSTREVTVQWGDCDPAGIVFYPNYFTWFDAAAHALIDPVWESKRALLQTLQVMGCPLAGASAQFLRPSRKGEKIMFRSFVETWEPKRFVIVHEGHRDGEILLAGREIRFLGRPHLQHPQRLQAIDIPAEFIEAFAITSNEVT